MYYILQVMMKCFTTHIFLTSIVRKLITVISIMQNKKDLLVIIKELNLPESEVQTLELKPIEMKQLGQFVAITGKNGSGKSRLLNKLRELSEFRVQQYSNSHSSLQNLEQWKTQCELHKGTQNSENAQRNFEFFYKIHSVFNHWVIANISNYQAVRYVPKQLALTDTRQHSKAQSKAFADSAKLLGTDNVNQATFAHIEKIQNNYREATHQDKTLSDQEIKDITQDYEQLEYLIESILKTKLTRSKDGNAEIFRQELADSKLSDGQQVLLALIATIHAQKSSLAEVVFIMDEPENHLHPSALIEVIEALKQVATGAQFWIATHSVPLLAYIAKQEPMSIWYMEDGAISNAGSKPNKVLQGLLGDDEQIEALNAFTSLPAQYAAINYAIQSLFPPKVVGAASHDKQITQMSGLLNLATRQTPLTLLDYGAGKGRLLAGLVEKLNEENFVLKDKLSYLAFDNSNTDRVACNALIEQCYKDTETRHFESSDDFFSTQDDYSVDIVVMCNVLHEISPTEWIGLFSAQSLIYKSLKDDGYLMIVEDMRIPVGEKAHQYGFLVLDTAHLKTLFSAKKPDMDSGLFISFDYGGDGRLKAHFIAKKLLLNLTSETRKAAIVSLQATAKVEINKLRNLKADFSIGRLSGFWTQQFANASLCLDSL